MTRKGVRVNSHFVKLQLVLAVALTVCAAPMAMAETLKLGGTGASVGTMRMLVEAFSRERPDVSFELARSLGSSGGIKAVVAGAIDIGFTSRPMKPEEVAAGAVEFQYATTPFVFVTSAREIQGVSRQDVVEIFNGTRTTWPDGERIRIVLRPESDTDSGLLAAEFPESAASLAELRESVAGVPVTATDQDNLNAAEEMPGSFAATSLCTVLSEHRWLTVLQLDGVEPSVANLESGAYGWSRPLYLVTTAERSSTVQAFIDFMGSGEGQRILREAGNLPVQTND